MASYKIPVSSAEHLKLYLFLSALAINLFLQVIIIANSLSIRYFFYSTPMIIQLDLLSPLEYTLLWIGSLYFVYITKQAAEETPRFRLVQRFLDMSLIGSFFLLFSVFLTIIMNSSIEQSAELFLNQLWFLAVSVGYMVSFAGSSLALFTIMTQDKSVQRLFMIYLFSLLIPVEIWSLAHWVAYPFSITSYFGFAWRGAFIELQLFYLSYPLVFWLLIAFLFSWIWVPLAKCAKNRITRNQRIHIKAFLFGSQSNTNLQNGVTCEELSDRKSDTSFESSTDRLVQILVLFGFLCLGIFIAYYPYIYLKSGLVGWDTPRYHHALTEMVNKDFSSAVQLTTTTDRPLYFLLLYLLRTLTQLPSNAIMKLMPIVTILLNAIVVFWLVKVGERKVLAASIAAVFSFFSFNTTIAMHAGILANWLAMALGFAMFGLILKLQAKMSWKLIFAAILTSASIFFVHYWSGIFFLLVLGCYMFLMLLEHRRRNTKFVVVLSFLASMITIALLSSGLASRFFVSSGTTENMGSTAVFALFWTKLPIFIDSWFFGALANPVMIALALIGIVVCFYQKTRFSLLLISWTIVGSLLSVFVSPIGRNMNQWLMWRTLNLIPFQIPATIGLFFLIAKLNSLRQSRKNVHCYVGDAQYIRSSPSPSENENLKVIAYLIVDYGISALLLILDFPIIGVLVFLNYFLLTLIVHFKLRGRDNSSILIFMFVTFITLLLFNYALRSLAPLTVPRIGS